MSDVVLVSMPFAAVQRPSLGLGLLHAALEKAGIGVEVVHADLLFAETIGLDVYRTIGGTATDLLLGEWCFAGAAFPDHRPDHRAYFDLTLSDGGIARDAEASQRILEDVRAAVPGFLDRLAARVLARNPRVVGVSSTFQQHSAGLALCRWISRSSAPTVTMMGGSNCEGEMGVETLRAFPWVDFVVSGEADQLIGDLCRLLIEHGREVDTAALPAGVIARSHLDDPGRPAPRAIVTDLESLPIPEYGSYFAALQASPLRSRIRPGLPVEGSRGCWWGAKSHCTFCGLNGAGMGYRSKSSARVLLELHELSARYGITRFQFADNILGMDHLKTLVPRLGALDPPYSLFFETKANLRHDQLAQLAAAGVRWIQPGLESLHDEVLALMGKGNSATINIQLLKWARQLGTWVAWNLLCGTPGADDDFDGQVAHWLPALHHLQPPAVAVRIRYDRFSPYHSRPADYGLELVPARAYSYIYPLPQESLMRLASCFDDVAPGAPTEIDRSVSVGPGQRALSAAVDAWQQAWDDSPPLLKATDEGDRLLIEDTRAIASAPRLTVKGLARTIYNACDRARSPAALHRKLPSTSMAALRANLEALCRHHLMLRLGDKFLSLGLRDDPVSLPSGERFPGGVVLP